MLRAIHLGQGQCQHPRADRRLDVAHRESQWPVDPDYDISTAARDGSGRLTHQQPADFFLGHPYSIGQLFLTDHLLAFEITSIVLLVAAVGGVILGAHSREEASMDERAEARS